MEEIPFALMRWIKAQQEKEQKHQELMVKKNQEDDKQYIRYLSFLIREWQSLKRYDRNLVNNFVQWHNDKRNFTPAQRSSISQMLLKYELIHDVA